MNKTRKTFIFMMFLIFIITGCTSKNPYEEKESDVLSKHGDVVLSISAVSKECVYVSLSLYNDGIYELFTSFKSSHSDNPRFMNVEYSKSIKGTYDINIDDILAECIDVEDKSYSSDELPLFELYTFDGGHYVVEKDSKNKTLDNFLNDIEVDLEVCASPDYD